MVQQTVILKQVLLQKYAVEPGRLSSNMRLDTGIFQDEYKLTSIGTVEFRHYLKLTGRCIYSSCLS